MAQSYTTNDGITLYDPGTYVSTKVIANQGGIGAAGIVTLIGEANEGPHWSEEEDLDANYYDPTEIDVVQNKYGSGHLVDAFRAISAAANDPAIVGSVQLVKIVKTNMSTKANAELIRQGFDVYANLLSSRAGVTGNSTKYKSEIGQSESAPTTGSFVFCPELTGSKEFFLRTNGSAKKTVTVPALTRPSSLPALVEDYDKGILCQGGDEDLPITGLVGIALSASAPDSDSLILSLASGSVWASAPEIGDVVIIPANGDYGVGHDSAVIGSTNANRGSYIVTAVTNSVSSASITLTAINIAGASTETGSSAIDASEDDILVFKPLVVSNYTGQDRSVADSLVVDWSCSSNDGTNVVLSITSSERWAARPQVGDTMIVENAFAGINPGFYLVTSATRDSVSAARLSNGSAGTTGTETSVAADFAIFKPVIDGLGKTMEVEGDVTDIFKVSADSPATFSNSLLVSAAEYENIFTVSQGAVSDVFETGGVIALKAGSEDESAKMVVGSDSVELYVGVLLVKELKFDEVTTLSSLVDQINSIDGFTAAIGSSSLNSRPLTDLDKGEYFMSSASFMPARIKRDAYDFASEVNGSSFITISLPVQSGLPEEKTPAKFLNGGLKGSTTSMNVSQAIDACDFVTTNFMVTLFAQDSVDDIADGETDAASTYTVDAINSLVKSHCIKNSKLKARNNRIGLGAKVGTFTEQQDASGELASHRMALCIQEQKLVSSDGTIKTYQPWMSSVLAAGMQAAAGFKGIVKKFINTSGVVHSDGSYNPKSYADRERALRSGLLVAESVNTGGFRWTSDQMTYSVDNNFVFNSLQAVYISDLMSLTLIQNFDRAMVGKSVAEVSAAGALSFLEAELFNFLRLKWIAPSDDAPKGYKNASVKITGGVMNIAVEVKLAGLLYFVPISLSISQVTQEASQ